MEIKGQFTFDFQFGSLTATKKNLKSRMYYWGIANGYTPPRMYDTDMDTDGIMEYTIVQHCTQDNKIIMMTQDPECISLKQRPASLLFFCQKIELKKLRCLYRI